MNNRQAGRRRGRGGQRQGGNPGRPENGNRIDNRARGNAAQLLEKYKNLARDAQMSGDRVNTEYYLQFADHYFRVLSESRSRMEENQARRGRDEQDEDDADDFGFEGEIGSPANFGNPPPLRRDQVAASEVEGADDDAEQPRAEAAERHDGRRRDRGYGDDQQRGDGNRGDGNRGEGNRRDGRRRDAGQPRAEESVREERDSRPVPANDEAQAEPRRRGRPRREAPVEADGGLDVSILPPSIGSEPAPAAEAGEERPRRGRPRRVRTEDEAIPPAA
ncbi:protein of unknown function [Sphingomonas guangdongensis]|uniref:DUF4167 domain-containing protein n=1 Tax=Sphingomonas guangdongensis TaxID=1141890 RepID=A0A285R2L5_9SPHN|nr:protein of unknown function [Sphingomonas guangdongensis]